MPDKPDCRKCKKRCGPGEVCKKTSEGSETCVCSTDESKKPPCKTDCLGRCGPNAKCIIGPNGDEVCACTNGGTPPACIKPEPICDVDCVRGVCKVVTDGKAECVCRIPELKMPNCAKCSLKCGKNQICSVETSGRNRKEVCVCEWQGTMPNCTTNPCTKLKCKPQVSRCMVDADAKASCQCLVAESLYPNCDQPPPCVIRNCLGGALCVESEDGKKADCVCRNGGTYPECMLPSCEPKCTPEAECVLDGDKSKCICKESAGEYPDCKPVCETCEDDNSLCVFREVKGNIDRRCVCKPGTSGISPNCVPSCENVLCPPLQKCVLPGGGPGRCACADPKMKMPDCNADPCSNKDCGTKAKCVIRLDQAECVCKDTSRAYPDCDGPVDPCQYMGCEQFEKAKCIKTEAGARCICTSMGFQFPACTETAVDPCDKIKCNTKGACFRDRNGVPSCVCIEYLAYPACDPPCPVPCQGNAKCVEGKCQCRRRGMEYPDCSNCDDKECEAGQGTI